MRLNIVLGSFFLLFSVRKSSMASSTLIVFASRASTARTLRFESLCCVIVDRKTFLDRSAFATVAGIVKKMRNAIRKLGDVLTRLIFANDSAIPGV